MRMLLIRNPGARSGRGRRLWRAWEEGLRAAGAEFTCAETQHLGHARELARGAAGCDTVVAVGGDGTINEVLDGLLQARRPGQRMGVLYSGTSPDFCTFHGIPTEPTAALRALLTGESHAIDLARIAYRAADGSERSAHFGCGANVGMGARIARQANRSRRWLGDALGTGLGLLCAFARNRRADLELEIDGEPLSLASVNNLSIAKNPYLASGLKLRLDLAPDDGKLCLVGVSGTSRLGLLRLLPSCYSGAVTGAPGVLVRKCRSVTIRSAEEHEVEFDGDPRGWLPCRIEILPRALELVGGSHDRV